MNWKVDILPQDFPVESWILGSIQVLKQQSRPRPSVMDCWCDVVYGGLSCLLYTKGNGTKSSKKFCFWLMIPQKNNLKVLGHQDVLGICERSLCSFSVGQLTLLAKFTNSSNHGWPQSQSLGNSVISVYNNHEYFAVLMFASGIGCSIVHI